MVMNKILIKDGGFATQLTVHVGDQIDGDPLWSARFNATNPKSIVRTHLDFLNAGADIILTNTYQTSVEGHMEYLDLDEYQSVELIKATVRLADVAREGFLKENKLQFENKDTPIILASIGPYGAHLHDGSEYTGSYADYVDPEEIRKWHRIRIDACVEAGVDGLAIETIPCVMEAEILADLICDEYSDMKFWITFQCKDDSTLAHGELFRDAINTIWDQIKRRQALENCLGLGVNCVHPKFVSPLFKSVNGDRPKDQKLPLIVYPNSGEVYDVNKGWTGKEDCVPLECYIPEWLELGAVIVGGCCRTYARDISRIKECVDNLTKSK